MVLRGFLVSGPITALVLVSGPITKPLLLRRLDGRLRFLGGARQALAADTRRVREDVNTLVGLCN